MADDLNLKIVIDTLLNAKGFDEAKAALAGLTGATNTTATAADTATGKQKGLARELGGTRGPAADLTRILLQQIGVTGAAGEAAKAAGIAFNTLGGAATGLTLGLAAAVALVALIAPSISKWAKATDDTSEATDALRKSLTDMLPELEEYVAHVTNASAELRALYEASAAQAFREQDKAIADNDKALAGLNEKLEQYRQRLNVVVVDNARSGASHMVVRNATMAERDAMVELEQAIADLTVKNNALMAAHEDGLTLSKQITSATKIATAAEDAARKIAEERARVAKANAAWQQQFAKQQIIDATKDMASQTSNYKATVKQIQDVTTEKIKAKGQRIAADKEETDAEIAERIRAAQVRETLAQQASATIGAIFGRNKAAMIAQAIIDTYAGMDKALAQGGWFGIAMAAMVGAEGFANVANMQKQKPGFDDPFNDMLASKLGRKSAADFLHHFGQGFSSGMGMPGGGGASVSNTTINRGSTVNIGNVNGVIGSKTQLRRYLQRELIKAGRQEDRTRLR